MKDTLTLSNCCPRTSEFGGLEKGPSPVKISSMPIVSSIIFPLFCVSFTLFYRSVDEKSLMNDSASNPSHRRAEFKFPPRAICRLQFQPTPSRSNQPSNQPLTFPITSQHQVEVRSLPIIFTTSCPRGLSHLNKNQKPISLAIPISAGDTQITRPPRMRKSTSTPNRGA